MPSPTDFDELWDFNDPAGTEITFRKLLPAVDTELYGTDWHLELLTQLARTQGLQRAFDNAHNLLNNVEPRLETASPRVTIRYQLERGRAYNSANQTETAKPLFLDAWTAARAAKEDALAVDAAHMLGIVESPEAAQEWNRKALELAESSDDPQARKWAGSLHNNIGWTLHGDGDFAAALDHFERALECRIAQEQPSEIRIARWCVGRGLRSLGRIDEALSIQEELQKEHAAEGTSDGYVFEELAECQHALGKTDAARENFAKAYAELSQDEWLVENEPDRIARLKTLGEVA